MDSTPGSKSIVKYRQNYIHAKQRNAYPLSMATLDIILVWRFEHQRQRFEPIVRLLFQDVRKWKLDISMKSVMSLF